MPKTVQRLVAAFDRLNHMGVDAWDDPNVQKRVLLTNKIATTMALICVPYVAIYAWMGLYGLAAAMPAVMSTGIVVPLLNRAGTQRGFNRARAAEFLNFAVSLSLYSAVLGHESMTHLAWFAGACLPFLLCDVKERGLIAFGALSQLGAYAFFELGGRSWLPDPKISDEIAYWLGVSMVPTAFGMLLMMVGYFATASKRAEVAMHRRNKDMRLVLDNVDQAFLTVDSEGRLAEERSAIATQWFGEALPEQTLWDYVNAASADVAAYLELGWDELWADILPFELAVEQLPKRIESDDQTLEIAYKPIRRGNEVTSMLVVFTDITAEIEREKAEVAQREILAVHERLTKDKRGFLNFFAEAGRIVERVGSLPADERAETMRLVHTLKGNCGLFGIASICQHAHALEQRVADEDVPPTRAEREDLQAAWQGLVERLGGLLGEPTHDVVEVDRRDYDELRSAITERAPHVDLAERLDAWMLEPTARRLERAAEQARALAKRLDKGEIRVDIEDNGLRLEPTTWSDFWSAFAHVLRNSVDHGLETIEQRVGAGKDTRGHLTLRTSCEGDEFVVSLADDGRGIDWDRVATKAAAMGLPHATQPELKRALFTDGFSTKSDVSDVSGRGVGLAAVRAAIEALGGRVEISTRQGRGTTFEFRAPRSAMRAPSESAPVPAARAA